MDSPSELFPEVLNLEDQFFTEGYNLGVADGQKSGRIEGRIFGLEKGFSKAIEMGRLNGKASIWEARMKTSGSNNSLDDQSLAPLAENERLRKHILRLAALSDPDDLSVENNEDDVSEFDDRLKDAKAKAVIIDRIVGEGEHSAEDFDGPESSRSSMQRKVPVRVKRGENSAAAGKSTGEMEDFIGRKGLGGS